MMRSLGFFTLLLAVATAQDTGGGGTIEQEKIDVRVPPSFTAQADPLYIYRSDGNVTLTCVATGTPNPEYKWYKDEKVLDFSRPNIRISTEGTLVIAPATSLDVGFYQCYAENAYGVAVSGTSHLMKAALGSYPPNILIQEYSVRPGEPLTINCEFIKSIPSATFAWAIVKDKVDDNPKWLDLGQRINIDPYGNLHFAYIEEADAQGGRLYMCFAYNAELDVSTGGSYSKINILGGGSIGDRVPSGKFQTSDPYITLVGDIMNLKCLFSGNPAPSISWGRTGGMLPSGRWSTRSNSSGLEIKDVRVADEGVYQCTGSSVAGRSTQEIQVKVEARPVFQSNGTDKQPVNINVTEGEDVTFNCKSYAIPDAGVQWLMNGAKLDDKNLPDRMEISGDGKSLTIQRACKDCNGGDRASDLMVVQCNSSNVHAYVFVAGYLNVLLPTVLTVRAKEELEVRPDTILQLPCEGATDDSTPLRLEWRFEDSKFTPNEPFTKILSNNTLEINTNGLEGEDWKEYAGKYTCIITNGYSSEKADTLVKLPPGEKPLVTGAGSMWWIVVIVGVILLILLPLICCICMQRNKGDTYPVDEQERENGNDPENELDDSGFADYQRPEDEPIKGSRASLTSTIKMDSDEEGSLAEYGDIDTGKFNEDGSFIGQYMEKDRRRAPQDTTV